MGGVLHTICYVAEIEKKDQSACPECQGAILQTLTQNEEIYTDAYPAEVFVAGGNLQSYRFDDEPAHSAPAEYSPDLKVDIPIPSNGYTHLCLKYNREGGPRINVVAVINGGQVEPAKIPANGLDITCPIAEADIDGVPVELDTFVWDAGQPTIILDQHLGAWSIGPPESVSGDLTLTFRPTLSVPVLGNLGGSGTLKFVSWERNRLSSWVKGTPHQWTGDSKTVAFEANTYMGVIAYYQLAGINTGGPIHIPDTKPGPETPGYPAPKWIVLRWLTAVWRVFFPARR
ncbi:hypothetical protein [Caulobacter sp.]|uniref:hypothetical protein n=1 Tax=Caulobacter sp. TaxID=78 RepID=UPI003BAF7753